MNIRNRKSRRQGLTLVEVLAVLAAIAVLIVVSLYAVMPKLMAQNDRRRAICVMNLKLIWQAEKDWRLDHGDLSPWQAPANEGGTMAYADSSDVFRHFQVISNELLTSQQLVCPMDKSRRAAVSFDQGFNNSNVSYFVGLDANEKFAGRILSGDRNLTGGSTNGAILGLATNSTPGWDTNIHHLKGTIAFSDGSVEQFTSKGLAKPVQAAFTTMTNAEIRLAIPRVPGE